MQTIVDSSLSQDSFAEMCLWNWYFKKKKLETLPSNKVFFSSFEIRGTCIYSSALDSRSCSESSEMSLEGEG